MRFQKTEFSAKTAIPGNTTHIPDVRDLEIRTKAKRKGTTQKMVTKRSRKGITGEAELRSPPPDKASRAEGEEADLEDYD